MAKDGPVNGVTEILEAIGKQDSSAAMERIKATGRSVSGQAGYMRSVVNSLRDQYQLNPTEAVGSAYAAGTSQLNQVLAYRESLKNAANFVGGGGLNRADGGGASASVMESLTKGASAAATALQQFNATAAAATQAVAIFGQTTRGGNGAPGNPGGGAPGGVPPGGVNGGAGAGGGTGGGQGGGGNNNMARGLNATRTTVNALSSVNDAVDNFFVRFPVEQKQLMAQYASRANDQYNIAIGAASGDAMSLLLSKGKAWQNATLFSDAIGNNAVRGAVVGGVLDAVGGGVDTAGRLLRGNVNGAITSGVNVVTDGFNRAGELSMGLTRGRAEMPAYDAQMSLERAQNYVNADLLQKQIDYQRSLSDNTLTMGRFREDFVNTAGGSPFLKEMAKSAGMSPTEFAAIAGQISSVTGGGSAGFQNFFGSALAVRDIERSGLGTRGESIGRMGLLANAGANSSGDALAGAIGQAVADGFDNSKAVGQIVESTAAVAERGGFAALGIDGTDQISSLVGQLMKQQGTNNQFQATAGARDAIAKTDKTITDTSVNLNNAMRFVQMNELTGGPAQALAAMKLSSADLAILQRGGASASKLAVARGLGGTLLDKKGQVNQDMVSKIVGIDSQFETAGGSDFTARLVAQSMGVTEEQKEEAKRLAETMGGLFNVRTKRPDLAAAVDALMAQGNISMGGSALVTGKLRGTNRVTYRPRGGGSTSADTLRDAGGRTEAAQTGASRDQATPDQVATAVDEKISDLTPEALAAMTTAAKESASAMGINNSKLKELTDAINKLTIKLGGKRAQQELERARSGSGDQTK